VSTNKTQQQFTVSLHIVASAEFCSIQCLPIKITNSLSPHLYKSTHQQYEIDCSSTKQQPHLYNIDAQIWWTANPCPNLLALTPFPSPAAHGRAAPLQPLLLGARSHRVHDLPGPPHPLLSAATTPGPAEGSSTTRRAKRDAWRGLLLYFCAAVDGIVKSKSS
jgi:hypothetical protein